ncbi:hypothetical protein PMAYCL1PPCAC_13979, partial [Pristionchus mayeri]
ILYLAMASKSLLSIVEEWSRKCYDFSVRENDTLNGLFMKVFDVNSAILKNSEHRIIQRALENLNGKRSKYQRFENIREKSIRSVLYGIVESLHLTIVHLVEQGEPLEKSLSIVEQWKRKTFEFSTLLNDSLVSICLKAFDVMSLILNSAQHINFIYNFKSIFVTSDTMEKDFVHSQLNIRYVMFGVIECLHLTLIHLMDKRNVTALTKQPPKQSHEFDNPSLLLLPRPIEDPFDSSHSISGFDEDSSMNVEVKKRKKPSDTSCKSTDYIEISDEDDEPLMNVSKSESVEGNEDSPMNGEVKKRKKPTDTSCKSKEYIEISDEDDEPLMKISKSESVESDEKTTSSAKGSSQSESVKRGPNDNQKNELECPECEANIPCIYPQCETYPKTATGYTWHLEKHHKSTLMANDIYLMCSCGLKVRSNNDRAHGKECDGRSYTLHRIDEE